MTGLHLIAELYDCRCPPQLLLHPAPLRELCVAACRAGGLTVVAEIFHSFGSPEAPAGATGAVVLAESHLAVHTWPELEAVTLDVYVCNYGADNSAKAEALLASLVEAFEPASVHRQTLRRGAVDGAAGA